MLVTVLWKENFVAKNCVHKNNHKPLLLPNYLMYKRTKELLHSSSNSPKSTLYKVENIFISLLIFNPFGTGNQCLHFVCRTLHLLNNYLIRQIRIKNKLHIVTIYLITIWWVGGGGGDSFGTLCTFQFQLRDNENILSTKYVVMM